MPPTITEEARQTRYILFACCLLPSPTLCPVRIKAQIWKAMGIVSDIMFSVLMIVCAAAMVGLRNVENSTSMSNAQAVQTVMAQEDKHITNRGLRFLMVSADMNRTLC